ncbi:Fe(3+) ABC transporter substrate-binding protein [Amaricoccus solimangrovi]|uniref:Fe(3+) ABC transporter substrate-binding protein n=1 Tax=Amaricoccus solimangrovi TaxID=2589815 RepID=A0A501WHX4_9RHOB|nr:Fe(3+) ABC transporter substrate-binding protein [Amaricoccus solimangrovi]TPE46697.1 Fe(3+) ABC transporter substrate-binding protein [Amaricoccus solimangrovi]
MRGKLLGWIGTALLAQSAALSAMANELNLYTTREPKLVEPLLESFRNETGIEVNTIFLKDGLPERLEQEGAASPADVLMTVDIGNLVDLVDRGLTRPVESEALTAAIPENLRDKDGNWFALSLRARALYAAEGLDLTSFEYEDLADPEWKGRVCIRSGQHPYNVALTAAYVTHHGVDATRRWLEGVKANLARKPGGGDRDVARDIMGGICDIGVANTYYVGLMRSGAGGPEQREWASAIRLILPTFENGGTQVNVSGAAVAKHAPNRAEAIRLLEFLVSDEAQKIYAEANFEYPVKPGIPVSPLVGEFGALTVDPTDLTAIARERATASKLAEEVGFDN